MNALLITKWIIIKEDRPLDTSTRRSIKLFYKKEREEDLYAVM